MIASSDKDAIEQQDMEAGDKAPLLESETRFAVVMYGGISLAIYIHGVAQELYHMVRATARQIDDPTQYRFPKVTGTELIYRQLGARLRTKFVVDVLSGTSAGGINAIFLAKALVNDRKMEFIKEFWKDHGDIGMLINDGVSRKDLRGVPHPKTTLGLLNSQRFYYKLLEAIKEMGSENEGFHSPYVEELDLNITATDIQGLNLPLQISNPNTIIEPRYKNVFRFVYRPQQEFKGKDKDEVGSGYRNDFSKKMDPFLAFAARCTASIPPAFEAMQLNDIQPILDSPKFKGYNAKISSEDWQRFYRDYTSNGELDFAHRSFGDGGYLDNKPFSYATDALLRRRADIPVNRLLVYIEPSPEHPEEKERDNTNRPDMLQNVVSAVLVLPRNETIREDLERIEERNEVIRRVRDILSSVAYNVPPPLRSKAKWTNSREWASSYFLINNGKNNVVKESEVIKRYGRGYIAYHQLLVDSVITDLSAAFTRGIGRNEQGSEEREIYQMFRGWVEKYYSVSKEAGKKSQNNLLYRLDVGYRLRRIYFLNGVLDVILRNLKEYLLQKPNRQRGAASKASELEKILNASNVSLDMGDVDWDSDSVDDLLWLLVHLKQNINETYGYLKLRAQALREHDLAAFTNGTGKKRDKELAEYAEKLASLKSLFDERDELITLVKELTPAKDIERSIISNTRRLFLDDHAKSELKKDLARLIASLNPIRQKWDDKKTKRIFAILEKITKADLSRLMEDITSTLAAHPTQTQRGYISSTLEAARIDDERNGLRKPNKSANGITREKILELLEDRPSSGSRKLSVPNASGYRKVYQQIQTCLSFYYQSFDFYDMLSFPITYGTGAGESDEVEVVRISPEDATHILNERDLGIKKLAGTALSNFGAFFKREWRENDILWGQLDAAEILIKQIDPQKASAEDAVANALESILEKDYQPNIRRRWSRWLKLLKKTLPGNENINELARVLKSAKPEKGKMIGTFRRDFEPDHEFPPETLETASRAVIVLGNLLEEVFGNYSMLSNWRKQIKSFSLWGAGLIQMAKDSPVMNAILGALYAGSILLLLMGIFVSGMWKEGLLGAAGLFLTAWLHMTTTKIRVFFRYYIRTGTNIFFNYLVPLLGAYTILAFWIVLLLIFYLGLISLGLPKPTGALGGTLQSLTDWLSTQMINLIGWFKAG